MQMRPRASGRSRSLSILAAAVASAALKAYGQTSGTWIPTGTANVDWNTPSQWIGGVPNSGGTATFVENTGSAFSPSINNNYTLSKISITSSAPYNIAGSGSITFPAAGGTLNINNGMGPINSIHTIAVPISGGPMTVTGTGSVYLSGANTFEGGVNISGGMLTVNADAALGATDLPADGVTLNNGTLNSTTALTTSRPITVNGTSTVQINGTGTLSGIVSGSGSLIKGPASGGTLSFTNPGNTFSGSVYDDFIYATSSLTTNQGVNINGQGALPNLAAIYSASYLTIDNSLATNSNRLGTNTVIYTDGGFVALGGLANTLYNETAGKLTLSTSLTTLTLYNGSTGVTFSTGITRQNGATLLIRGTNLSDATPSAGTQTSFVFSSTAPTGLTGGGALGTANASVVPWIVGVLGQTSSINGNIAQLVTYNSSNGGIRPLLVSEYASSFGVATNNVRLSYMSPTLTVPAGGATCNSLTVTSNSSSGITVGGTGTITDTSGAIMIDNFIASSTAAEIDAPIAFPSGVEGIIQNNPALKTTGAISGNTGVTKTLGGIWTISGNGVNSTYSGPTTIDDGTISISSNLPVNQNSALGNTASPIILAGGAYYSDTLQFTASGLVVDRAINFTNTPSGLSQPAVIANSLGTQQITFNGPLSMNTPNVYFEFGLATFTPGAPTANGIFNGVISGPGTVNDSTYNNFAYLQVSSQIFNGANSYTGGTLLQNGWDYAGNNMAFGTGTITTLAAASYINPSGLHDLLPIIGATAGVNGTDTTRTIANKIVIGGYGLNLNNAIPLTLTGSIQLSPSTENPGVTPTILIDFGAPSTISGTISDGSVGNTGLEIAGNVTLSGTNTFTGGVTLPSAGTNISPDGTATTAGYVTFASPGSLPAYSQLTINAGATVVAANHGSETFNTLLTSSLSLDPAGLLDLTNNALVIRTGSSLSTVTSAVAQGFNGGTWQASAGITSSAAAANSKHLTALGVIVNDNGSGSPLYGSGGTIGSTFGGSVTPVDGDILVKYTYYGDANLDGKVDGSDYSRIDAAYITQSSASPLTGWYNGDFNYDGVVNGSDYTLIDNAFNTQGAVLAASIASPDASPTTQIAGITEASAVPEPTTISLLIFGSAGLLGRRRRRSTWLAGAR